MSRIGKKTILLPPKVTASVAAGAVTVKGPLGELSRVLPAAVTAEVGDGKITIGLAAESREGHAVWGLTRALVANMVEGVGRGFAKELEIVGVGYKAEKQGSAVKLSLGYTKPRLFEPPTGITLEVPAPQFVVVKGADRELVGHVAAKLRMLRPPEPYKGKGIRYRLEKIRRKVRKGALGGAAK